MNQTYFCEWDAENERLEFTVAAGNSIDSTKSTRMLLPAAKAFGRLPAELDTNDARLRIESTQGQIILQEAIKESDEVIGRMFIESSLTYTPKNKLSTFMMHVHLKATVNITAKNPIVIRP